MANVQTQALAEAEAARPDQWKGESFLRQLFLGDYRVDLLSEAAFKAPTRAEFWTFYERFEQVLKTHADPVRIDETGEYPPELLERLAEIGAFGMKIPKAYGGLGLTHAEYIRAMTLVGGHDANVTALLSAHQAIGVPQPIMMFGSEEQRRAFLPRCAAGAISAFALTEPAVGSDPAKLATSARKTEDGRHFILNGAKLWCTNGTLAEVIVVMARDEATEKVNAFILDMSTAGVHVTHRSRFMGLRALANAYIELKDVKVPSENLIGGEGQGLKIALATLNTGRLSLPAATAGLAKRCTEIVRKWSRVREQWGEAIGKHEAVAHMNARVATQAFAMEALAQTVGEIADREETDIRLEAAAAKEWNTVACWALIDDTLQIRGGRGYETERSLEARGEAAIGVERAMRDARINLIFEGSSEIMHLFIAREAVDKHLEVAGALVDPKASLRDRLAALPKIAGFYAKWYSRLWFGWNRWPQHRRFGKLAKHVRFAERATRRLARNMFYGMALYRAGLEKKQAFLFRAVDVATELFALTAAVLRAHALDEAGSPTAPAALELADAGARDRRRRVDMLLSKMWKNDDRRLYGVGRALIAGNYQWLEKGTMPLPFDERSLAPKQLETPADTDHPAPPPTSSNETSASAPTNHRTDAEAERVAEQR